MTAKEKLFCENYLALHCPTQAALKSGYTESDAKKAQTMLRREDIKNYLRELEDEAQPLSLTKSAIRGLERLAFSSPENILDTEKICPSDLFCISELKRTQNGAIEVKFYDRIKALQALYEIGKLQDENMSVPFFEALKNAVPDTDDGV